MPDYSASGEENLRADAKVYTSPGDKTTPAKGGTKAGGDDTGDVTVYSGSVKSTPTANGTTPKGVQSFDGEAV